MDFNTMKIIDFGTAVAFDDKGNRKLTEAIGTPYYIAPEVL
jgi:serine/threonine protein kinase